MKNKSILLGLILGAIAAVAAHAQNFSEEFHQTYPLNPGGRIELKNINGSVKITSWDRPEVKVDALKYAGTRERLADASIKVQADPGAIAIRTRYKDRDLTFNSDDSMHNPAGVDYTLTVPASARLDGIKLVNGDLDIQGISGDVDASCVNGHLRASGLRGRADLKTVNGTLELTYEGVVPSDTKGTVIPSEGGFPRAFSSAGNPSRGTPAHPAATSLSASSQSGNDLNLKSVNGSVVVTLPSDTDAELRAKTVSGSISNDFGLPVDDGRYVGHSLAGRLGSGAARIDLKNVNGSVSIQRASDGKPLSPATNLLPLKRAEMD
jgi:DUF4097 and DUF4098 domain-containing protein YvlB